MTSIITLNRNMCSFRPLHPSWHWTGFLTGWSMSPEERAELWSCVEFWDLFSVCNSHSTLLQDLITFPALLDPNVWPKKKTGVQIHTTGVCGRTSMWTSDDIVTESVKSFLKSKTFQSEPWKSQRIRKNCISAICQKVYILGKKYKNRISRKF